MVVVIMTMMTFSLSKKVRILINWLRYELILLNYRIIGKKKGEEDTVIMDKMIHHGGKKGKGGSLIWKHGGKKCCCKPKVEYKIIKVS